MTQHREPGSLNVCLIVSGSIAAYKALELAGLLAKAGHQVQFLATESALRFVGAASMEGLSGRPAYHDLWARRESMTHIELRRWSDLFLFYPATANRINALAAGLAPDLLGATFLANNFEKPFWIAPAMNTGMMEHPATRAALERLESWGCRLILGQSGRLACGDSGPGRLAEPMDVFSMIQAESARVARERLGGGPGQVLVTGGAMREPIDAVRSIINSSSGRTASSIVRALLGRGCRVDYLAHSSTDVEVAAGAEIRRYDGFPDFSAALEELLRGRDYIAVVHAAAVSDYGLKRGAGCVDPGSKLESGSDVELRLEPRPKLLPLIRSWARGRPAVVSFKLTVGEDEASGARRAAAALGGPDSPGSSDYVVWNDADGLGSGPGAERRHAFVVFGRGPDGDPQVLARGDSDSGLAAALAGILIPSSESRHA
jgi:phosphopantothenoylcysteine decarboxylase/phosphopantothenate--cysteine ligase